MNVAYIFSTTNAHYILSNMIVPQLEVNNHGFNVVGMFFFVDNTLMLVKGNDIGERLGALTRKTGMLVMACDRCAHDRKIAESLVPEVALGCFPDLHAALQGAGIDQVITL